MQQTISQLIFGNRPQARVLYAEPNRTSILKRLMNTVRQTSICLSSAPIEDQILVGSGLCPVLLFEYAIWFPKAIIADDVPETIDHLFSDEGVEARIASWYVPLKTVEEVMDKFFMGMTPRPGFGTQHDDFANFVYDVNAGERFKVARFGLVPLPGSRICA